MTNDQLKELTEEYRELWAYFDKIRPSFAQLVKFEPYGDQWVDVFENEIQPIALRLNRLSYQIDSIRRGKTPVDLDDARTVSTFPDAPPPQELSAVEAQAILEGRNVAKRLDRYIRLWIKREKLTNERRDIKNLITADAVMKARYQEIGKQVSQINFRLKVYRGEKPRERRKP